MKHTTIYKRCLTNTHLIVECGHHRFGSNCVSMCHCLHEKPCDSEDGICDGGLCAEGWKDRNCSVRMYTWR